MLKVDKDVGNRKKVLLMGRAGAGKTSMRSIIFANYKPRDTIRFTTTNNIEHSHLLFFGNLTLSIWDCGGQDTFMENYFESQRENIFRNTQVLIYVMEARSKYLHSPQSKMEIDNDLYYYRNTVKNLKFFSPESQIFCLLHKIDRVPRKDREATLCYYKREIENNSMGIRHFIFPTTIWDESLYAAWSEIVCALIPNVRVLEDCLEDLSGCCEVNELVLLERSTFLVISFTESSRKYRSRFEKISNICKRFKITCARSQTNFTSLVLKTRNFVCMIKKFTRNSFILAVLSNGKLFDAKNNYKMFYFTSN
ncbi:hypothetical protein OJ253_355 [Cryptosporidium canis]|uniref:Uncharacterized protein n=1 Tax=Cryptosporidium canis TaxID=195482 RepID=A0A9D5HYT9_9CRYT|nr:hypothetical protein OJ253_355 [Cryptosporidium canis]